jgi:hypothetical protein
MKPFWETITEEQRQVIDQIGPYTLEKRMYLAGGTAVALHVGHRKSVDLDWFSLDAIADPMSMADEIRSAGVPLELSSTERGTLHGTVLGVRVSILHYGYPLLQQAESLPGFGCQLASLPDLAAMKLVAVSQRGSRKDFVDIYAIGVGKLSLEDMLAAYRQRYSVTDVSRILYSLVYFTDADVEPMPAMLWNVDWKEMKRTIQEWVQTVGS